MLNAQSPDAPALVAHALESPWLDALWRADAPGARAALARAHPAIDPSRVAEALSLVADPSSAAGAGFLSALRAALPSARVEFLGPPGTSTGEPPSSARAQAWSRWRVDALGSVALHAAPHASARVTLHVGAGADAKRWPLDNWMRLSDRLAALGREPRITPVLLAGEVEAERFTPDQRAAFLNVGGRFLTDAVARPDASPLDALVDELLASALYLGADTGPTHLAAQLGVPTIALFGPTDPSLWAPVGPRVQILAPAPSRPRPTDMSWLTIEAVFNAARAELAALNPS